MHRSLTTAETDAQRCHHKNVKALRLGLKESKCLAKEKVVVAAKVERLAKEWAHAAQHLAGLPSLSLSPCSDTSIDDDPPSSANMYGEDFDTYYRRSGDAKGKGLTRKW